MKKSQMVRCLVLILLCSALPGCAILKEGRPNLPRIYNSTTLPVIKGKRPLIIIPGILGSSLVNSKTGEIVWPAHVQNNGNTLALPIFYQDLGQNRDELVAKDIVYRAKFFRLSPVIGFYDSLLTSLEQAGGYRHGSFDQPSPDGDHDTYYVFAYDWRRDNVESARILARQIVALKEKLNRPDLQFDVIAHSMGGLVARYCLMYGDRDVVEDENPIPNWAMAKSFFRLFLFGTPNSGSMDALGTLVNGYSVLGTNWIHLKLIDELDRDTVFTTPSVYQLLPHRGYERFLDGALNPIQVDLFDPATWKRFAWSIAYDDGFREREVSRFLKEKKRLKRKRSPDAETRLGELEERTAKLMAAREPFLTTVLRRARGFHRALDVAAQPPDGVVLYLFGGDCEATLEAVVIKPVGNVWKSYFRVSRRLGNAEFRRRAEELMFVPGDNRVTRRSLMGLRLFDQGGLGRSALPGTRQSIFYCEWHGDLPLAPTLQDNMLAILMGGVY